MLVDQSSIASDQYIGHMEWATFTTANNPIFSLREAFQEQPFPEGPGGYAFPGDAKPSFQASIISLVEVLQIVNDCAICSPREEQACFAQVFGRLNRLDTAYCQSYECIRCLIAIPGDGRWLLPGLITAYNQNLNLAGSEQLPPPNMDREALPPSAAGFLFAYPTGTVRDIQPFEPLLKIRSCSAPRRSYRIEHFRFSSFRVSILVYRCTNNETPSNNEHFEEDVDPLTEVVQPGSRPGHKFAHSQSPAPSCPNLFLVTGPVLRSFGPNRSCYLLPLPRAQ